jgi:hypothetical protein
VLGREHELEIGRTGDTLWTASDEVLMPRDRKRNQQKQTSTRREFAGGLRQPNTGKQVPWRWLSATESDQQQAHERESPDQKPVTGGELHE